MRKRTKELSDSPSSLEVFRNLCQRLHDATRTFNPASIVEIASLWQSIMEHELKPNMVIRVQLAIRKQHNRKGSYTKRLKSVLKNLTSDPEYYFKNKATTSSMLLYFCEWADPERLKSYITYSKTWKK